MCAIAGLVGLPLDPETEKKMEKSMRRRGPDESGVLHTRRCCLLHRRLSIIDPKGGKQPMQLQTGEDTYTIVYNGELYNTAEIRKELESLGHVFLGHSDTEVVLHAYVQWKENCLEKFNGIFAFGVWHHRKQRLFLARDRMGVKPLFYTLHKGGIIFVSEIKTVLSYPTVEAKIDAEGIGQLILLGPGRKPGSGIFCGINELEPGCCGTFEDGKWKWSRYWYLRDREHTESFSETVDHVRYLVMDSIERQMISDVEIGTFLSGGLDSSIITSVCARKLAEKGSRLPTFSVDYENNERYFVPGKFQPNSDNHYIQVMQNYLDTEHHWTVLDPQSLVDALPDATLARDLPGMADVDFSLLVFCGQIRDRVKVALSGECADEIFGGYPWYRDPEVRALDGFPWAQNTKERASVLQQGIAEKLDAESFVMDCYNETCRQCDILPETPLHERRIKEMVNLNHRWFMQTLLDRKDRMSMYHGLEVRVPFCDHRIASYLYGVPWGFKDFQGREKGLLRCAVQDLLPEEVLWRKKSPYPKTYDPTYEALVSSKLRSLLKSSDAAIFSIVRKEALEELLEKEYPWPWYGQLMKKPQTIAYFLQIQQWLETWNVDILCA